MSSVAAAIASIAVSAAVFVGCDAALGIATGGVGAVAGAAACGALAGAAGNAVSYAISSAQSGKFSWTGLAKTAVAGAVVGGLTAGLTEGVAGAASGLLSSGTADAASALSSRAADEVASTTTEAAATTADSSGREAAEDAASRSDGEEPAQSEKSESCLVGGQSFSAGTKVLTVSGALVAISKLKPGEKVLATSTRTGKTQAEPIAAVLVHHDTDLYDLKVRAAGHTSVIKTTSNHLFWNQTTHRWTKAGALKYGTHLRTPASSSATALGGWTPKVTTGWMWDLTIPGNNDHDFYIQAAAASVLVHNEDDQCPLFPLPERDEFGKIPGDHTAARVGESRTLSGGSPAPEGYTDVNAREVLAFQDQIGFPIRRAGFRDFDGPGSYFASHAERKAYVLEPDSPISVSKEMCPNCQEFFQHVANRTGITQYVTDPNGLNIFQPAITDP